MMHLGLSYAADPAPEVKVHRVEVDRPPPDRGTRVLGVVVQAGTNATIPGAQIIFEGRDWTGMVSNSQGRFETPELPNGSYSFRVSAESYREGSCSISLPISAQTRSTQARAGQLPSTQPLTAPPQLGQLNAQPQPSQPSATKSATNPTAAIGTPQLRCELLPAPRVGNIEGVAVDAKTNQPIATAKIKIIDKLNRALELQTDARGAFRFERVPEGSARLIASAEQYLGTTGEWRIELNKDTKATISLIARPKVPNVTAGATAKELTLRGAIAFEERTAVIAAASMALVEEIADLLQRQPDLLLLEIQVHGAPTGDDALGMTLSRERANALREALVRLGVSGARLRANGYAQSGAKATPERTVKGLSLPKVRIVIEQRKGVEPAKPATTPATNSKAPTLPATPTAAPPSATAALPTEPAPPAPRASAAPAPSAAPQPSAAPAPSASAPAAPGPSR
jgi:outer membrane protein OmpA-like peptidoglycan-associated protein